MARLCCPEKDARIRKLEELLLDAKAFALVWCSKMAQKKAKILASKIDAALRGGEGKQ